MDSPIVHPDAADLLVPYPDHVRQRLREIAVGLAIENAANTGSLCPTVTVRDIRRAESLLLSAGPPRANESSASD